MPAAFAFDRYSRYQTGKGTDSSTQGGWQVHYALDVNTATKTQRGSAIFLREVSTLLQVR
jgi:L,D-peptidoglycan transpeptidase YkuD (ErfK/YbiS/YcfS/YnhG family)